MSDAPPPPPEDRERGTELSAAGLSGAIGGLALLVALASVAGPMRGALATVALPLALLLFLADVAWMLRSAQRGPGGMAGLVLAGLAVALAAAAVLARRDHPWLD